MEAKFAASGRSVVWSLSQDLWAKVFSHLQPIPRPDIHRNTAAIAKQYSYYHQLQLVCKRFCSVFLQNPALFSQLFLDSRSGLEQGSKISLFLWMRRYGASLRTIDVSDGFGDTVMAALTSEDHRLPSVGFKSPTTTTICLLSMFTALSFCNLCASESRVDLMPLHSLPHLGHLLLSYGQYTNVSVGKLHYLCIECAKVTMFSTNCVLVLKGLAVINGELVTLHSSGLTALTSLQDLVLKNSLIHMNADNVVDDFDCRTLWTGRQPEGLSSLTRLTSLQVSSPSSCLKWVYQLTSLKALHVVCFVRIIEVQEAISQLSNLTSLNFQGAADDTGQGINGELDLSHEPRTEFLVNSGVKWQALSLLTQFRIDHATLNTGAELMGLVGLKHLQKVEFVGGCTPTTGHNVRWFAVFVHQMALQHPLVEIIINEGSVADAVADL